MIFDRMKPIRDHQIEQILLNAHVEREAGVDLIDEYFLSQTSLDPLIKRANELIKEEGDLDLIESIKKNLSECIVVKTQYEKNSWVGRAKKVLSKWGVSLGRSQDVLRAERFIHSIKKKR